jgi:hypothetical protein
MSHKLRLGAIIRNGAKTISSQNSFGDLIIIIIRRNGAKTISSQTNNNKKWCNLGHSSSKYRTRL